MPIDTETEKLIAITEAAEHFPGRRVCLNTLHRWRLHGVRGVKLESVKVGATCYTSKEAILRFIASQNPEDVPRVTDTQRKRHNAAVQAELAALGIGLNRKKS